MCLYQQVRWPEGKMELAQTLFYPLGCESTVTWRHRSCVYGVCLCVCGQITQFSWDLEGSQIY